MRIWRSKVIFRKIKVTQQFLRTEKLVKKNEKLKVILTEAGEDSEEEIGNGGVGHG